MVEQNRTGVYNATGPDYTLTMGALLDACHEVSQSDAKCVWGSEAFLAEHEIAAWSDMPVWVPDSEGEGFSRVDCSRAIKDGLTFRAIKDTVRDTLDWFATLPEDRQMRAGLSAEREQTALQALKHDA